MNESNNPMPKMRLFVAIPLPESVRTCLSCWAEELRKKRTFRFRRWVHPADYHLTLLFMGERSWQSKGRITELLSLVAARHRPFHLHIAQPGTFGPRSQPRILWAGVQGDLPSLRRLQSDVAEAFAEQGIIKNEERLYRPHITIARQCLDESFQHEDLRRHPFPERKDLLWPVREIILYRTHMGKSPMYESLAHFPLGR
ncbi:RNA 2',3'-cyclic phosphodiesterase [Bacillaceae bacterium]